MNKLSIAGMVTVLAVILTCLPFVETCRSQGCSEPIRFYAEHEFDQAIDSAAQLEGFCPRMITCLALAEKYALYKSKTDKATIKTLMDSLELDISLEHLPYLDEVLVIEGNPNGRELAEDLLKAAFEHANSRDDILLVATFLDPGKGSGANKLALATIEKTLKQMRGFVEKGGTLPSAERSLLQNKDLLRRLADLIEFKDTALKARRCLVEIEEPALATLEARTQSKAVLDTINSIKKAILQRKKKQPQSTWYSAIGE